MKRIPFVATSVLLPFIVACGSADSSTADPSGRDTISPSNEGWVPPKTETAPAGSQPATAPAPPGAKPDDGPCFAATASAKRIGDVFDSEATIEKMFLVGSRLAVVHGDELSTLPAAGGTARFTVATSSFIDAVPSGDRIFMLDGSFLTSTSGMLETPDVISANATAGIGLHVDANYIYFSASFGNSDGYVARHERTNVYSLAATNLPEDIAKGPVTKWIGGTNDKLFVVSYDDNGAKSGGAVYSMLKPGGSALTAIGVFDDARPIGFVIDDAGGVIATTGEYSTTSDDITGFAHDGTVFTGLVSAPKGSISSVSADASRVYYVSARTSLMRVARAGGVSEIVAASTTCQITAIASEATGVYVATTKTKSDTREIWFFAK